MFSCGWVKSCTFQWTFWKPFKKVSLGRIEFLNNNWITWKFLCNEHRMSPTVSESAPLLSLIHTIGSRPFVLSRESPRPRAQLLEEASPDYLTDGAVQSPTHHFSKLSAEHSAQSISCFPFIFCLPLRSWSETPWEQESFVSFSEYLKQCLGLSGIW